MHDVVMDKQTKLVTLTDVIGGAILGHSSGDIVLSRAA